jgi:hypothetical protein
MKKEMELRTVYRRIQFKPQYICILQRYNEVEVEK